MAQPADSVPLVVDLDGTLLRSDALLESFFSAIRAHPLVLLSAPFWLLKGIARLKQKLAEAALMDVHTLPLNLDLLQFLHEQKRQGRRLILATGADQGIASAVAQHCGLFESVIASDGVSNLRGCHKRERLVATWGERGFDYIGNSAQDLPVWSSARRALLVNPSDRLRSAAASVAPVEHIIFKPGPGLGTYASAIRVQHWLKNLLVGVPLLADHKLHDPHMLVSTLIAMCCFSLAASGVYLFNDLLDLGADRKDPCKKERALASGDLPINSALWLMVCLWLTACGLGLGLPREFLACIGVYLALMLAYSLRLKDLPMVDAIVLGMGYSLRLLSGALALGIGFPIWLLICSSVMFFGLALLKRYAEMTSLRENGIPYARVIAYPLGRAERVATVGITAGGSSIVLLALYPLVEPAKLQGFPVWLLCGLLLIWMGHMWQLARFGQIRGDPVSFALHDPLSRFFGILTLMLSLVSA